MTRRGFLLAIVAAVAGAATAIVPERLTKAEPTGDAAYLASLRRVLHVK